MSKCNFHAKFTIYCGFLFFIILGFLSPFESKIYGSSGKVI